MKRTFPVRSSIHRAPRRLGLRQPLRALRALQLSYQFIVFGFLRGQPKSSACGIFLSDQVETNSPPKSKCDSLILYELVSFHLYLLFRLSAYIIHPILAIVVRPFFFFHFIFMSIFLPSAGLSNFLVAICKLLNRQSMSKQGLQNILTSKVKDGRG